MVYIENELKDENFEFLNDLHSLNKDELVGLIYNFWKISKEEAERQMKNTVNFRQEEYGRLKMTQVNRLKIMAKHTVGKIKLAQEQQELLKAPDEWLIELKRVVDNYLQANGLPDTKSNKL